MVSWHPHGVDVGGVDEVEARVHELIEEAKRHGFIDGPTEDVSAQGEGSDLEVGFSQGAGSHDLGNSGFHVGMRVDFFWGGIGADLLISHAF